jgi:signal peptidase I
MPLWWHVTVAVVLVLLVQALIVKVYSVPSGSMEQTLDVGDRILVNRLPAGMPQRGEIVVFEASGAWESGRSEPSSVLGRLAGVIGTITELGPGAPYTLVKRVIGLPGETVACCDAEGRVEVDGAAIDEPYVYEDLPFEAGVLDCTTSPRSTRCFGPIEVPEREFLVLGDHRGASADSVVACRGAPESSGCARFVDELSIVGRAFLVFWPLGHAGAIR